MRFLWIAVLVACGPPARPDGTGVPSSPEVPVVAAARWHAVEEVFGRHADSVWNPRVHVAGAAMLVTWGGGNSGDNTIWARGYAGGKPTGEAARLVEAIDLGRFEVAGDGVGDWIVVWNQDDPFGVFARVYDAREARWGAPQGIGSERGSSQDPVVGMNARGDAIALWVQHGAEDDQLWARRWAAGAWEPNTLIDEIDGSPVALSVSVDDVGNAIAAWEDDRGARRCDYRLGRDWPRSEAIDPRSHRGRWPRGAMSPDGAAAIMWFSGEGVFVARRAASGWLAPERINPDGQYVEWDTSRLRAGAAGLWAMWRGDARVWLNRYARDEGWVGARPLAPEYLEYAQLAVNDAGFAITAWVDDEGGVVVSRWDEAQRSWAAPEDVSADPPALTASVGVDSAGNVLVVWDHEDGISARYWGPAEKTTSNP